MRNLKVVTERMADLVTEMDKLANAKTETGEEKVMSVEERSAFDAFKAEYDSCLEEKETLERKQSLPSKAGLSVNKADKIEVKTNLTQRDRDLAFRAWLTRGNEELCTEAMKEAAERSGINIYSDAWNPKNFEAQERQHSTTNANGGYLINGAQVIGVEQAVTDLWDWKSLVNFLPIGSGSVARIPTFNNTGNTAALVSEAGSIADVDVTFSVVDFAEYKVATGCYPVTNEVLLNSAVPLESLINGFIAEQINDKQLDYLTTGTGSSQPGGVVTGSTLGVTAADDVAITQAELLSLYFSVKGVYANSPKCAWMMNRATFAYICGLADSTGRALYGPALNGSPFQTLMGKPVVLNDKMADRAAGAKTILFGDFSRFYYVERRKPVMKRSSELYFGTDQMAFIGLTSFDSKVVNAGTGPIKHLIMAAS
jgi:HK97 family phage major capsid protein